MASLPITENPQFSQTMDGVTTETWAGPQEFNPRYQVLLDNDNYLKTETDKIKGVKSAALLAADWSAEAPYTQTVPVAGVTAEDTPYVSPYIPAGSTADEEKAIKKPPAAYPTWTQAPTRSLSPALEKSRLLILRFR